MFRAPAESPCKPAAQFEANQHVLTSTHSFGLQIAAACGANVIATSSSDEKLEIAKKLGATHTINYKKTPDWEKEVEKIVRV